MTAYDYLKANGCEPTEAEQAIIARGLNVIAVLSHLRELCSQGTCGTYEAFIATAEKEYEALYAATEGNGIMSKDAFMDVVEGMYNTTYQ